MVSNLSLADLNHQQLESPYSSLTYMSILSVFFNRRFKQLQNNKISMGNYAPFTLVVIRR
jgi:hypothetical protein